MITITYKGSNYLTFGKKRIGPGATELTEDEFYKLMAHPSFKKRVEMGMIVVPPGIPLEKPKQAKKANAKEEKPSEKVEEQEEGQDEEEVHGTDRLSSKQTLKNIAKSEDIDYLQDLVDNDDREKVKEAAKKRLEALDAETK